MNQQASAVSKSVQEQVKEINARERKFLYTLSTRRDLAQVCSHCGGTATLIGGNKAQPLSSIKNISGGNIRAGIWNWWWVMTQDHFMAPCMPVIPLSEQHMAVLNKEISRQIRRQDQAGGQYAILLRDEVFNTVPGMVNVHWDAASWAPNNDAHREYDEVFDIQRFPHVPETPAARDGTSWVTMHHSSLQPVSFNISTVLGSEILGKDRVKLRCHQILEQDPNHLFILLAQEPNGKFPPEYTVCY